jgi:hypothetical protein
MTEAQNPVANRPKLLCKFRPWKVSVEKDAKTGAYLERHRTKEILLNAQFYCQPPRFFDDPHDGVQGARATGSHRDIDRFIMQNLWGVPEMMRKHGISSITQLNKITDPKDRDKLKRLERKHRRREMRVLSLSGVPGCELMWAGYGDNHRGICLCFDAADPFFAEARAVRYVDGPEEIEDPIDDNPIKDPLLYAKSTAWAWQFEWRLVWSGENPKLIPFPREALKAVVLGEWFQHRGFDELIETLKQGRYRVRLLQMERMPESFDYQVVPLGEIQ